MALHQVNPWLQDVETKSASLSPRCVSYQAIRRDSDDNQDANYNINRYQIVQVKVAYPIVKQVNGFLPSFPGPFIRSGPVSLSF